MFSDANGLHRSMTSAAQVHRPTSTTTRNAKMTIAALLWPAVLA